MFDEDVSWAQALLLPRALLHESECGSAKRRRTQAGYCGTNGTISTGTSTSNPADIGSDLEAHEAGLAKQRPRAVQLPGEAVESSEVQSASPGFPTGPLRCVLSRLHSMFNGNPEACASLVNMPPRQVCVDLVVVPNLDVVARSIV